jgi:hypothetical protein
MQFDTFDAALATESDEIVLNDLLHTILNNTELFEDKNEADMITL